ncbi:KH homology domain-containing protein 4-like isoform X2 [Cynoglossus semilaevis]|uniref:KH homology domain-containing protein 4-like isoform X2 n=1 Tax=Cynoglossus semilaevis TaxID=244447 RepID=UPI000D62C0D5|nr:KH homology domain-containing protein 4-like isoform X2 [Cynoglossus semilaevis]
MSSGMTGQTPCFNSRWDQPAQPKQSVDVRQQRSSENAAQSVSLSGVIGTAGPNNALSRPQQTGTDAPMPQGGVEMAAAMAAKINAMLMAKGKLLTPPPLLKKVPQSVPIPPPTEELVITEVDINDVPLDCRDLLTKGKTQEEIRQLTGAVVTTKGHFMCDVDKPKVGQRPLYLHVQGKTQDEVNRAVMRIKEIISEEVMRASGGQQVPVMPPLTLYPQPPRPVVPVVPRMPNANPAVGQGHRPAAPHTGSFVHTKIFVGLDQAPPSFNVNEKIEGPGGSYLGHIQTETGARVFLRGKGSGYIEQASKRESFEPLYVYISHPNSVGLEAAKKLTESLLETVRAEQGRTMSMYSGSTQSYQAHGYPTNSNYSNQRSWYNYPANGYAGAYSAYPEDHGYWSNANGPPSQSNMSTNPQSSQAMVQYPVCSRKPHPYLVQESGSVSEDVESEGSVSSPPDSPSPKHQFQEAAEEEQPPSCSAEAAAPQESALPATSVGKERAAERILMPPPPPPFCAVPAPAPRKRPREGVTDGATGPCGDAGFTGVPEDAHGKKFKAVEDAAGLVPYGGDSSDEEEERTHSILVTFKALKPQMLPPPAQATPPVC